jgi:hypothetical protein
MDESSAVLFGHCRGCTAPSDVLAFVAEAGLGEDDPYVLSDQWRAHDQLAQRYRLTSVAPR